MTSAQYSTYFTQQKNLGRRPIDIEVYPTANGFRYAAIWYQNTGNVAWIQLRGMSRTTYQNEIDQQAAAGYRVIDFKSYQSGSNQYYAAIWEKNPAGRSYQVRSDRTELGFANLWRQYRDEGYRLVDFERYNTSSGVRYAGVWVENYSRFDYPRKGTLNQLITSTAAPIPCRVSRSLLFVMDRSSTAVGSASLTSTMVRWRTARRSTTPPPSLK